MHVIAKLDHSQPVQYDAVNNPNYLSFTAVDSLGKSVKVVYHNAKPDNLEASERLVLKGAYKDDHFECKEIMMKCPSKYKDDHFECKEIMMKCPSKYKDDMKAAEKNIQQETQTTSPENNSTEKKY